MIRQYSDIAVFQNEKRNETLVSYRLSDGATRVDSITEFSKIINGGGSLVCLKDVEEVYVSKKIYDDLKQELESVKEWKDGRDKAFNYLQTKVDKIQKIIAGEQK